MAHRIEDNMIAYTGETPWHGLGYRVTGMTPEQMLKTAGMDWVVEPRSIAVSCTLDNGINGWCHSPAKGYRAITRKDNGKVFQIASDRYQPVQNIEIARFFADWCDAAKVELCVLGALEGGAKVWALAKVSADYMVGKADRQDGYVLISTSHDGSLGTQVQCTAIYVVCWNTLSAALYHGGKRDDIFKLRHTSKFSDARKEQAADTVGFMREQLHATAELAERLARVSLDSKGRVQFVRELLDGKSVIDSHVLDADLSGMSLLDSAVAMTQARHDAKKEKQAEDTRLGKQLIEAMLTSPGSDLAERHNTLWGAVNGVTYVCDHERGRTQDSTLSSAWYGPSAALKGQAVQVAKRMAGIA